MKTTFNHKYRVQKVALKFYFTKENQKTSVKINYIFFGNFSAQIGLNLPCTIQNSYP